MWTHRDYSYEEALQERVEEGDDGRAVRAALALGDLLVAVYGGPPPLPAMLLWQCVATVGCRVCGSVCVGAEVVAAEFDVVPQWAFGCRLLDALCRGDPAAADACDLRAMPRDVLAAVPHAVAHYADGSERDDVRASVVQRAKQADTSTMDDDSHQPEGDDDGPWCRCSVGVQQLLRFADLDGEPLCVAAACGASKLLLLALEPSDAELAPALRRCAIAHAAASDAVSTMATLIDGDAKQVGLAVLVSVHFGAVRCLEMLVTDFGAPAVAAAATALVERDPTHVMLQFSGFSVGFSIGFGARMFPRMLCALPAMPQVGPTLQVLKRCGAPKLSAEDAVQLVASCNQLLRDEREGRLVHLWPAHAAAATPPAPWEHRVDNHDVLGSLVAALDVLGWEGDLAAAAEEVRGSADTRRCGLLAVLYDRGVRPTAAHVARACADGDAARVVHILSKAAPDGVDFSGADKDASDCLLALVKAAAANAEYECEHGRPSSGDPATWAAAVAALIAAGAALTSPSARAALRRAVQMASPAVAEVLLDAGTPIDAYECPLHHAVGAPANVAMLLRRGATVDARSVTGSTALAVACGFTGACKSAKKRRSVDARSVGVLLDHGASLDNVDGHGTGVEEFFLRSERLHEVDDDIVEDVLLRMRRARGVGVSSVLVTASRTLHAAAVRVVAGTLDTAQLAEVGATALLAACGCTRSVYERLVTGMPRQATVKTLLDVVPPPAVHATDDRGCTPLHLMLDEASGYCDHCDAVGELLRRGADANAENVDGHTALEMHLRDVDRHGRSRGGLALGCVEALLEHGARCRCPLALHAVVSKCIERDDARVAAVARQLIALGAPVDQRDEDGRTAEDRAQQRRLHLTRAALASAMGRQPTVRTAPVPCSASSGRSSREHSPRGEGGSRCLAGAALRRRARPTFSSSSSDDGDETGRAAASPAPRRHRRETRR